MSEAEWGESWDDWESGSNEYSFGPNGEYMDMSTMDVGWWNSADYLDGYRNAATPTPGPRPPTPHLVPTHLVNEKHFVNRAIRHYHYIRMLDLAKMNLNSMYEHPPKGYSKQDVLDEMNKWMDYCEQADKMKGDLRITSHTSEIVSYMDWVQVEFGHMPIHDFVKTIKENDEQAELDMATCIKYYEGLFEDMENLSFALTGVLNNDKEPVEETEILIPYDREQYQRMQMHSEDITRRFSRAGGLESGFGIKYRLRTNSDVRKHLDKIGVDLAAIGHGPIKYCYGLKNVFNFV